MKKKQRTYADKANALLAKYKWADRVSADKEALDSAMLALFEEQEAYKQANGMGQPTNNQFAEGGPTPRFLGSQFGVPGTLEEAKNPKLSWMDLDFNNPSPTLSMEDPMKKAEFIQDALGRASKEQYGTSGIEEQEFGSMTGERVPWWERNKNASTMNIASGVASGLGDIANMLSVRDPKRINPHTVNPTFSFQESDLTPYTTALDKELASTRYGFLEAGADFDTASAGVIKANDRFATNRGQMFMEQSRLNQEEAKRGDSIMNTGMYFNATNENQADIDLATRTDAAQQKRRDYLASLSDSISNIFKDEADRMLGEELSPYMRFASAAEAHV